jgi:hypothetical protein
MITNPAKCAHKILTKFQEDNVDEETQRAVWWLVARHGGGLSRLLSDQSHNIAV